MRAEDGKISNINLREDGNSALKSNIFNLKCMFQSKADPQLWVLAQNYYSSLTFHA